MRFLAIVICVFSIINVKAQEISFKAFDAENKLVFQQESSLNSLKFTLMRNYQKGDYFIVKGTQFMQIQFDLNIPASEIYAPTGTFRFNIPVNENGINYPKLSFSGTEHFISIRVSTPKEKSLYRNVALNSFDIRGNSDFYPHATSNSECRGESYYAARNAIDGYKENTWHGKWPYQSWGPDKGDSLWLKIDFGRKVQLHKLVFVNRAQYADLHDSYWMEAKVEFSDGKSEIIKIEKTHLPQEIKIKKHKTTWVRFSSLKAYEPKWCSWIEVEAWGK